jgi:flagellar motor switch protein FliG
MAASETKHLAPADRAAVLLMSLGEEAATAVMKHMGPKEVQSIGSAMATLQSVSRDQAESVIGDFVETVGTHTALGVGSEEYIRSVMINALGADKAGPLVDRILMGQNSKGLESLKWMDARAVAEIIRLEHPQIISIVISYLDPDQAAEVLTLLPERVRTDVVMRIATLDGIQPSAIRELDDILEKHFMSSENVKQSSGFGGVKAAADILNLLDGSVESVLIDQLKELDADLSQQIQDKMFVFDNLAELDDRGIQGLMREVSSEVLVIALKGADEEVREKIFANMSKRAAEMLRDDLEVRGPVRLSEVEGAQKEILGIARRMADAGEIVLGGKGAEQFV